jgi:multimeric flavodoxin WrbA
VRESDLICIVSPVYWQDISEHLKAFLDRLRRCENPFYDNEGALSGKPTLLIAVPGGSGNGAIACLEQLSRFCGHTKAVVFDAIGVNRWNAEYKRAAAYSAAKSMAQGVKPFETCRG